VNDLKASRSFDRWSFRLLLAFIGVGAAALLAATDWYVPSISESAFWNALVASWFWHRQRLILPTVTAHFECWSGLICCIHPIPRVCTSLSPPWPMVIALVTGLVAQLVVRRKTLVRAAFNTSQYMLFVGLGGWHTRPWADMSDLTRST